MAANLFLQAVKYLSSSKGEEKKKEDAWHERRLNDEAAARMDARLATKNWKDENEVKKNYRHRPPPKYPLDDDGKERKKDSSKRSEPSARETRAEDRRSDAATSESGRSDATRSSTSRTTRGHNYYYDGRPANEGGCARRDRREDYYYVDRPASGGRSGRRARREEYYDVDRSSYVDARGSRR